MLPLFSVKVPPDVLIQTIQITDRKRGARAGGRGRSRGRASGRGSPRGGRIRPRGRGQAKGEGTCGRPGRGCRSLSRLIPLQFYFVYLNIHVTRSILLQLEQYNRAKLPRGDYILCPPRTDSYGYQGQRLIRLVPAPPLLCGFQPSRPDDPR